MRIVIQRVKEGRVEVDGQVTGAIGAGLVVLLGIAKTDSYQDADYLVEKILNLRIFPDDSGKMNRSLLEVNGGLLIVSNFTVYGDCRKGRRPSFDLAADPEKAQDVYHYFVRRARSSPVSVETGVFRATMSVYLVNDGPVTLSCESAHI
ncbi:MAG: D-tyrosyl-tRNA(Tyr) deacylase [Bryobacterales bacterium]|jgi:D-tyrosyl-tRNA(Tyr) deacylase|nr:D-tyrosyl-tRNA(Tyr) deacylase [Bryobacterales bacterium]